VVVRADQQEGTPQFLLKWICSQQDPSKPDGFTVFMFKPLTAKHSKDKKESQQQVRSMFRSTGPDDDAIKYYAENDLYLANTLKGLKEQICTCVKCLKKFTEGNGIATKGFELKLQMLQDKKWIFHHLFSMDRLFAVTFAYLLDRVFQNSVNKLGNFEDRLKNYQVNVIKNSMMGYDTSCAPPLFLPSLLQGDPMSS
jgi:hypothetical protein